MGEVVQYDLFGNPIEDKPKKDWSGDTHSVFVTVGASNHSKGERQNEDFYASHPEAGEWLMRLEKFEGPIWEPCCVDCDTEFFNGKEWKKISDYKDGENVLCYDGIYGFLEVPSMYHKYKTDEDFICFKNRHLDMKLTKEHTVVFHHRRNDRLMKWSAEKVLRYYLQDSNGFRGKIPTTFRFKGTIELDEWLLRLAVACNADGRTRTKIKQTYQIRVKKERKKERILFLLRMAGIKYSSKTYDGYLDVSFISPYGCKQFPAEWIFLTDRCKRIFFDELRYWDSSIGRDDRWFVYCTSKKKDADIAQFIAHTLGYATNVNVDNREDSPNYRVSFQSHHKIALKKKKSMLTFEKSTDGYKYCFSVSSGMLILRRQNRIFVTGNCGQGHLATVFESHGYEVKSTDLIDRGYGEGGVNFLDPRITEWNGAIVTNPPFAFAQEIIEKAISIIPMGQKVAMFLRTLFLEGQARRKLFDESPPKRVWVTSKRIVCAKNGDFEHNTGGAQSYSWFIFEKGYKGDTILKWFN